MGGLLHLVSRRVELTAACLEGCVVDEHVNAPILLHRLPHHLQAHLLIVQVAADEDALAALRLDDLLRVLEQYMVRSLLMALKRRSFGVCLRLQVAADEEAHAALRLNDLLDVRRHVDSMPGPEPGARQAGPSNRPRHKTPAGKIGRLQAMSA